MDEDSSHAVGPADHGPGPRAPVPEARVDLEVEIDPAITLAAHENGVAVLKRLTLRNLGDAELLAITLRATPEPAFATPLELRLAALAPGARHSWESPALRLSRAFLAGLAERQSGSIDFEVLVGEEVVHRSRAETAVLAYDQWAGVRSLPELLAAFVLPNHPSVAAFLREAAALLETWTSDPSLSGYQAKSRDRVLKTAAAIYHAIQAAGITYVVPPASFEREGQKIRTPDRIAEDRLATCLDLAALAAACLEQAGLNPLLVVVEEHAFAGVWLDEATFPEPTLDDGALLVKRAELGELALFDPTAATARPPLSFERAMDLAKARLAKPEEFHGVIDVARARKGGIRPLPLRAEGVALESRLEPSTPRPPDRAPDLAAPRAIPEPGAIETPSSRIERWKRRLLDLTNRNRLLNFAETKKSVRFSHTELGALEDVLAEGKALALRAALSEQQADGTGGHATDPQIVRRLVQDEFAAGVVVTSLAQSELDVRLTEIYRSARVGLEEGGASGLYLALGFLEWFEDATSTRARRAPLILVPVDLQRGSIRQGMQLRRAADETRFNTTLLEMLRVRFGIEIRGIEPLPEDENGIDVTSVLQSVRSVLRDVPRWRVLEEAWLGFFTFAKFLMWKDLHEQSDVLLANRMVSHLVERRDGAFDPEWSEPDPETLDEAHRSADVHCPVPADSSQLAAVMAAAGGKSFVLEGPPGTGKSQTITNLIAHCLSHGRTVLFVSEKIAALNVVFERLRRIGLERFCLELHSSKASKAEVIRQLGESLRGARVRSPQEWGARADELDQVRRELNAYARAVSREHANGLSVFRATSQLTALRSAPSIELEWPDIEAVDERALDAARAVLRDARNALLTTGEPHGHALAGVGVEDASPATVARIRERFAALRAELAALRARSAQLVKLDIDPEAASVLDLRSALALCEAALDAPAAGTTLVGQKPELAGQTIRAACTLGGRRDELRRQLSGRFELGILELDLAALRGRAREAAAAWFVPRFFRTRALRRALLGVTQPGVKLELEALGAGIEAALELRDTTKELVAALEHARELTATAWNAEASPWADLETLLEWATHSRARIVDAGEDAARTPARAATLARWLANTDREALRSEAEATRSVLESALAASEGVAAELRLAREDEWYAERVGAVLPRWEARMERIEPAVGDLRAWARWRRLRSQALEHRLGALVRAVERGAVASDELVRCFERSHLEGWIGVVRAQEPVLRDFLALSHEQRIARFRELDARCTELARKVIEAELSQRVPDDSSAVAGSALHVLRRELEKKARHKGPRKLVQEAGSVVQRLKPCFLMSPISVAQYLPPGALAFDLVVFDEASQIPTWDAVGAIARGDQAVVVGDSKQLPPTSFFDVVVEDSELDPDEDEVEELESILDECRAVGVPPLELRWHYRSRHESLIAFSNRRYYRNRLHTFPAAAFDGLGVQWHHVPDGCYDKGRSRTNRVEARALVDEITRRLREPQLSRLSIGVVTFSSAQQRMVEDMLDQARRDDASLDRHFIASDAQREPVFIKNLENVQGDERDVILFSVCYGPDESGRVSMNFGPLNAQGGERRLNVAVTRARRELLVFSTITADRIDLNRTRARGVADLKAFLAYAQHGMAALPAEPDQTEAEDVRESPLEQEIGAALRARGHEVHSQVGCSGYRIDLAVVDPEHPGRYLLGIECDGANYHSAKTARDRDRLRQSVLEGLGWTLARIWSSDWWEQREAELERVSGILEAARVRARTPTPPPAPLENPLPSDPSAMEPASSPLVSHALAAPRVDPIRVDPTGVDPTRAEPPELPRYHARRPRTLGKQDEFYKPAALADLLAELDAVVTSEGPIRLELVTARIVAAWGFERTRVKAIDHIDVVAQSVGIPRIVHGTRVFLWPRELDPKAWRAFRSSTPDDPDQRDHGDLPPEEVANAAEHLLAQSGACPRPELLRALARLFGFRSLGAAVTRHLEEGLDHLLIDGRAGVAPDDRIQKRE